MANSESKTYSSIYSPYDNNLQRSSNSSDAVSVGDSSSSSSNGESSGSSGGSSGETTSNNTPTETTPNTGTIIGDSLTDLYLETFIKSRIYMPKVQGIYIDGRTGYFEAQNAVITGDITAETGYIGGTTGWTIAAGSISSINGGNTTTLASGGTNAFIAGPTGAPTVSISHAGVLTATGAIISGTLTATAGFIGGWTINTTSITDTAGTVGLSSTVTGGDDIRFWAGDATPASAPFKVTEAGVLTATSGAIGGWTLGTTTLTGTGVTLSSTGDAYLAIGVTPPTSPTVGTGIFINKTGLFGLNANTQNFKIDATNGNITSIAGTIGGFTIGTDYLIDTADSFGLASTVTVGDDVRFWAGSTFVNRATAPFMVTEAGAVTASAITITGGSISVSTLNGIIQQTNLNVADRGWSQTCAFSVTDATTIAWGAGTFTSADGTAYSIVAGSTGVMSAKTYIYLDTAVSTTVYQITTTATTAVGVGKVLVAVAQNGTNEATYKVLQGQGGENIDAASIVTGSITANEIAASTITAAKMNVTTLSSMAADLGTITAGTITINTSGYVRGGQTDFATGDGWFIGYSGGLHKLSIGTSSNYLTFDGEYVRIKGNLDLTSIFNNIVYTVSELPIPPTTEGFLSPSAFEY